MSQVFSLIHQFNAMYGIPTPTQPTVTDGLLGRLIQFKAMMLKEIEEVDVVIAKMQTEEYTSADVLTEISDWLGDIIVYAGSEALRHGIPIDKVLEIIMASNFSKLQDDGTAKFVEGHLEKGPNYWKPEPMIRDLLIRSVA